MHARIRPAEDGDLEDLTRIYNHYVRETPATFDIEPYSLEDRRAWLADFDAAGPYRCWVAVGDGRVEGWACTRQFRTKAAYDRTVETSVYLDPDRTGRGLGSRLYGALFESLADSSLHLAVGGVTLPNPASVALHRRFGFEPAGVLPEVGWKFGRYWDVAWFSKRLQD